MGGTGVRMTLSVVDPQQRVRVDAVLDADPETLVGDVIPELLHVAGSHQGSPRFPPQLFVQGSLVDPSLTLHQSPLREGSVVSLFDPSGCPPAEPSGLVELRVVGGPGAGAVHRLGIGRVEIGHGPYSPVKIADPSLPAHALTLRVRADGTCTVTAHGDQEVRIDGSPPEGEEERVAWPLGAQVALGDSLFELAPYTQPDAALRVSDDGAALDYNRPPRLLPPQHPTHFRLIRAPQEPDRRPLPWVMAFMPLVGSVLLAVLLDRWLLLIMAALSPIMLFANYLNSKKQGRIKHAKRMAEHRETVERIENDARHALAAERYTRRHVQPDPATLLNAATGPRTRLWERRRYDDDYLRIRVGTCELDSNVILSDPDQDEHRREVTWKVADAPVAIPLKQHGVIGFAGPDAMVRSIGRWAVGQLAVLHSPNDVQFYILTDTAGQESWDWARWLPHCRPAGEQDTNVLIGSDPETIGARLAELTSLLDARSKAVTKRSKVAEFSDPDIVIVFDGSRRMRTLPGVIRLLKEGPALSMYAVCLDDEERFLPGECQAIAVASTAAEASSEPWRHLQPQFPGSGMSMLDKAPVAPAPVGSPIGAAGQQPGTATGTALNRLRVEQRGEDPVRGVLPDSASVTWCQLVSRALAPLRDISDEEEGAGIPNSSRLLDVLQLEPPTAHDVAARWQAGGQSTTAVLGESYDGPFAIDLRRDGPHGLIAGTTGSGKSELLQTIVASLAVANTPEDMTFVLVDYKGGAAFKDCVELPHTVGMVTDLDNHLVERALRSLGAELHRREHILGDAGAKDIEDFQDLRRREPGRHVPMPRLLIVIDEFASMARELPDFVKGLVNIAQRGRSLGIHLLLATQRPSGVVSPEIRANTNLRIALRVTDSGESQDVIDAPDASLIPKSVPGRAFVRLGVASMIPFQSGRVGGRRPGSVDPSVSKPWVKAMEWSDLGRSELKKPKTEAKEDDANTDLRVLVDSVTAAARQLRIPQPHSPWLPPLPDVLRLEDVDPPPTKGSLTPAVFGLEDVPEMQARRPLAIDFTTFGHLLAAGAPRTGRSQLLRTIAGSLARTHSARDVHLFGFDCGNGALNVLTRLPQCGAIVSRNQTERARRLLKRLAEEISRRQEMLAADALADIGEQRDTAAPDDRLPHLVVLLDRWEGWLGSLGEVDNGALTDQLFYLMREGASVGVHLIITGDQRVLSGRISSLSENKMVFRLQDRSHYSHAELKARDLPEEIPPGRMYRGPGTVAMQIAVLDEDLTGQGQAAALTAIGEQVRARSTEVPRAKRPIRVDVLPQSLTFDDAWEMRDPETSEAKLWTLVGVGGDELTSYGPDMSDGIRAFVVAGPAKSGRSTVLCHMARTYLHRGVRLLLCAPRESPLTQFSDEPGVVGTLLGAKLHGEDFAEVLNTATLEDPIVLLMDDAEDLRRRKEADEELKAAVVQGPQRGISLVLAGDEGDVCSGFSGWQAEVKKARRGLLLSPASYRSGDLIGTKLPRSVAVDRPQPGNGILHLGDGVPMSVRLPRP